MMRKNMLSLCVVAAVFALSAGIVEETRSRPELVCTMEVAPFGDVAQKVTSFGTMINNPIVPTLLLTTGQQQLVEKFGRFRADVGLLRNERDSKSGTVVQPDKHIAVVLATAPIF